MARQLLRPRFGLALSGGGVCGLAHIGVLKTLEAAGLRPDYLSGASMGGVIAAAYAAGLTAAQITEIAAEAASRRGLIRLADVTLPSQGILRGERLLEFFDEVLEGRTFAELSIPLTLVAVDLNSDQEVHLCTGAVAPAVRATVSVPGLFPPVEQDGMRLVDGALLNNIPADVVREMGAQVVVAVDVYQRSSSIWQELAQIGPLSAIINDLVITLGDSLDTMIRQQRNYKLQAAPPDFLIQPETPLHVSVLTGFDLLTEIIAAGEAAAQAVIPALVARLAHLDDPD